MIDRNSNIRLGKETERIMRATGRYPVSCDCERCRRQCMTPCLGTPRDILRLIEAGHASRLSITFWAVGMLLGQIPFPILMVQVRQTPRGCVFHERGLCSLHEAGLKPTEGRLSHHSLTAENFSFRRSLAWNVAREWLEPENAQTIRKIIDHI